MQTKILQILSFLLFIGQFLYFLKLSFAPYIYIAGAMSFATLQLTQRYKGKNFIIKRLQVQQALGAVLLIVAGILMLTLRRNEWIVCMSIAAVLQLYTAFRIPQELRKEKNTPNTHS